MGEKPSDAADRPAAGQPDEHPVPKIPLTAKGGDGPAPAFFSPHAAVLAVESAPVLGATPTPAPAPVLDPHHAPVVRRAQLKRHRVLIGDARHNGRYLRATWHGDDRMFVFSTWADEVCTGAVRLPVEKASELINLLSDGLGDAVNQPVVVERRPPSPIVSAQVQVLGLKARMFRMLRTAAAKTTTALRAREVTALAKVHEHKRRHHPASR